MKTTQSPCNLADLEKRWVQLNEEMRADGAAALAGTLDKNDYIKRDLKRQAEQRRLEEQARAIEYFEIDGWNQYYAWLELGERALQMAVDDGHPSARYAKVLRDAGRDREEKLQPFGEASASSAEPLTPKPAALDLQP